MEREILKLVFMLYIQNVHMIHTKQVLKVSFLASEKQKRKTDNAL